MFARALAPMLLLIPLRLFPLATVYVLARLMLGLALALVVVVEP